MDLSVVGRSGLAVVLGGSVVSTAVTAWVLAGGEGVVGGSEVGNTLTQSMVLLSLSRKLGTSSSSPVMRSIHRHKPVKH